MYDVWHKSTALYHKTVILGLFSVIVGEMRNRLYNWTIKSRYMLKPHIPANNNFEFFRPCPISLLLQ